MKHFNVSDDKLEYVINILKRRNIKFEELTDLETCKSIIACDLSSNEFHRVIVRAACEKATVDTDCPLPILAEAEYIHPFVRERILRELKADDCYVSSSRTDIY